MPKFALDTSCIVALLSSWHEHHAATLREFERRVARREQVLIPLHALLESYAVLTRLPKPLRASPASVASLLEEWFLRGADICVPQEDEIWSLLRSCAARGRSGGAVYDATIAWTAHLGGAAELLTWNVSDFASLSPPELEIRTP